MIVRAAAKRLVCVGNPLVPGDDLGHRVHERLLERLAAAPPSGDLELVDGGLAGIDLLPLIETATQRVVFVDALSGLASPGEVVVLDRAEASAVQPPAYGHSGGLGYLLAVLDQVAEGRLPEVLVVGTEGLASDEVVRRVAERSWEVAVHGRP